MLRKIVLFAGLAFAAAFSGAPALNGMAKSRTGVSSISMQMDRRQVLQAATAAVIAAPAASFASSGDFPKVAIFGSAPISAPFGDTYGTAGAPIWEKLGDTERSIYERILTETKGHLKDVEGFISQPSWDAAQTELRLGMYETRKAMVRLSDVSENPESKSLFGKFKRQIEALDQALVKKDADTAFRLRAAADVTYGQWLSSVGL